MVDQKQPFFGKWHRHAVGLKVNGASIFRRKQSFAHYPRLALSDTQAKRAGRRQRREGAKQPHAGLDPCAAAGRRTATGRPQTLSQSAVLDRSTALRLVGVSRSSARAFGSVAASSDTSIFRLLSTDFGACAPFLLLPFLLLGALQP